MGRLRTLTFILILGAAGAATEGAAPDDAAASPATAARKPAPVPPVKYLEAGARLFNSGQFDMAAKYLDAAQSYKDQLQPDEQATLDAYLKELGRVQATVTNVAASTAAPAASAPRSAAPAPAARPAASADGGAPVLDITNDAKQKARWMLHEAREQIGQGNYDAAEKKIAEAEAVDIKWGLFDDTPTKVRTDLAKARPKGATPSAANGAVQPRDHRVAREKLKEARAALAGRQFEQAESIAMEVKQWGLSYGLFEDNPDKVSAAARALRKRDKIRNSSSKDQPSQGVYDVLVQESRHLMKAGRFDEAETKARQAQRMNVVPSLTADRAEAVLHEIAMNRARKTPAAPSGAPPQELASIVAEREANDLLEKGDQAKAAAKYAESEKLHLQENGQPGLALSSRTPTRDPAVTRVTGDSASAPALDAPAGNAQQVAPKAATEAPAPVDLAPASPEPAAVPAPAQPALELSPAEQPRVEIAPTSTPTSTNRGEQLLSEARALYAGGNYPAARQTASEAKDGKFGVDAQVEELLSQIALAEQGGALSLYESALAAMRSGDNVKARAYLTEVAAAGVTLDESLQAKVQELLRTLSVDDKPAAPAGRATVGQKGPNVQESEALAAQKLNAEVGTKIAEARRLQETDPDKALAIYDQTLKAVKAAGLTPSLMRPMVRRLEVATELAKKDKVAFEVKMQDKTQRAEIELKRLRILEADKAKKIRMKELMDKAQNAYAEGNFVECEAYAKKAAEIDPNEVSAIMLVYKAKTERRYKQDLDTRNAKEAGAATAFQEVDLAAVANPEVQLNGIQYAKTFKDLTRERLRMNAKLETRKDPKVLVIEGKLKDSISTNFDKQPLSEAITFLQNYTGLNIVLDPKALTDEGLTSASPVSLQVNNVQLKTALKLMLRPLGLTYKVEDEVLLITSPQANSAQTFPRPYYVGDLIMPANKSGQNPIASVTNPLGTQPDANGMPGQAMPTAGQGIPGPMGAMTSQRQERPEVDMTPLIQLITTSIAPGTWRVQDNSGQDLSSAYGLGGGFGGGGGAGGAVDAERPPGAIIPFMLNISLIIRHTAEVHEQVADLLRQLRRLQDLQISIEVRFITVSDNFFEQIGVDFDFSIQSDAIGKHSTLAFPTTIGGGIGGGGVGGGGVGGGGAGGGLGGGGAGGGAGGGGAGGGAGGGGGGLGGGGAGGGAGGGLGGGGGGGLGGGGAGGGAGGGLGGGGAGGGAGGGLGGGGGGGGGTVPSFLVNPIRDHALPSKLPVVVGTQGGGLYNFSQNLQIPFTNTNANLIAPTNAVPGAGATLGLAFLSDLEVYFFLTAAQGDVRSNILEAPKVTTFNGANATILNALLEWYIQSLFPVVGPGSVAFVPQPAPLPNGVILNVTPVVSADRRYVRMTLSPTFNTIDGFTTIQVPAAVGGAGLGGGAAAINATIQLPRTNTTLVTTTVTVPDGGTVLLGGVKRLNEERREFGVPVLSKTPWIDRLFRNVGIGRVSTSLMLMVTPRIIILEEEEEKLGIPSVAL